ncbi:MAG: DinB family protein [Pedobacter sp.]|nr:MAG: DinB family protein [Pedobacter sp.]
MSNKVIYAIYNDDDVLMDAVKNWSTDELDEYCIPHPVLGKLTVREMIYFTSIHTEHHRQLLQNV